MKSLHTALASSMMLLVASAWAEPWTPYVADPEAPRPVVLVPLSSAVSRGDGHFATGSGPADRTVVIRPSTRAIDVGRGETVDFIVREANGAQSRFAWKFDGTAQRINLADLVPQVVDARGVWIYVD